MWCKSWVQPGNIFCLNHTFFFFSLGEGVNQKQRKLDYCPWRKLSFGKFIIPTQFQIKNIFYLHNVQNARTIQRECLRPILCANESVWATPKLLISFGNKILAQIYLILEKKCHMRGAMTCSTYFWLLYFFAKFTNIFSLKPSF